MEMVICTKCLLPVSGGFGSLARHQAGMSCRVKAAKQQEGNDNRQKKRSRQLGEGDIRKKAAEVGAISQYASQKFIESGGVDSWPDAPPDNEITEVPDPAFSVGLPVREDGNIPDDVLEEDPFPRSYPTLTGEGLGGPLTTASARFREIEKLQNSTTERRVVGVHGEEVLDANLVETDGSSGALVDDAEADGTGETLDKSTEEHILHLLMALVSPPDGGGSGLKAVERQRAYNLVDACLSLLPRIGDTPQPSVAWLIRKYLNRRNDSCDTDRLFGCYMDSLTFHDGWESKTFSVATGHSATAHWDANIVDTLKDVVLENWEFMMLKSTFDGVHFGHPVSGVHMFEFESMIRRQQTLLGTWDEDQDFVVLLVLFSDGTQLVNKGSLSAHPITLSIANLPQQRAMASQTLLGLLGDFDKTTMQGTFGEKVANLTPATAANIRRALLSKQTQAMVREIVLRSYLGVRFKDPTGKDRRMFFTLFCAPLDHPEICSHLGHKNTYCGICYWKTDLEATTRRSEFRSREFVDDMNKAPASRLESLRNKFGAYGQPSGLWGFNGSCPPDQLPEELPQNIRNAVRLAGCVSPWTDIQVAVAGESMHEIDLGLLVYVQKAIFRYMQDTMGMAKPEIEDVNENLRLAMTVESRVQGLNYPPTKKVTGRLQGYFGGSSRVEAKEHRAVLQFLVPVLARSIGIDAEPTKLVAVVVKYYRERQRLFMLPPAQRVHTPTTLDEVDRLFAIVESRLYRMQPDRSETKVTPKMHQQTHFREQVMRLGITAITTGQAGEANNSRIKSGVRQGRTNQQKESVTGTLVKLHRYGNATRKALPETDTGGSRGGERDTSTRRFYETATVLALRKDRCAFTKHTNVRAVDSFFTSDIHDWATCYVGSRNEPRRMRMRDTAVEDSRRDLTKTVDEETVNPSQSPAVHRRLELLMGDHTVGEAFLDELCYELCGLKGEDARRGGLNLKFKVVSNATNPSVYHGDRDVSSVRVLQRIRVHPTFRGKGRLWNDFVAVAGTHPDMGDSSWYARLILMFHVRSPESGTWVQMVFLRYMRRVEKVEEEEKRMLSDDAPAVTQLKYATRTKAGRAVWYFGVCLAESILRKVHVVAANEEGAASLKGSRGERKFFEEDRKARFFLNHSIWSVGLSEPYELDHTNSTVPIPEPG